MLVSNQDKLPLKILRTIEKNERSLFVSIASLWEIAIKINLGKLNIAKNFFQEIKNSEIKILDIDCHHIEAYLKLPLIHRDPFDRILVAQSIQEELTIVTSDEHISKYNVTTLLV